jgi:hypothetical protein
VLGLDFTIPRLWYDKFHLPPLGGIDRESEFECGFKARLSTVPPVGDTHPLDICQ